MVNKLAKFSNNPGLSHYKTLLHLVGFVKSHGNKYLKFYKNINDNTVGYIAIMQGDAIDHGLYLPVPVEMFSVEVECIASAVAYMRVSHLRMLGYDIGHMGENKYNPMDIKYGPS